MKFSIASVFLAGATSVFATPTVEPRAITGPTQTYTCDVNGVNKLFNQAYITKCITTAAATKSTVDMLKELPNCDLSSSHSRDRKCLCLQP